MSDLYSIDVSSEFERAATIAGLIALPRGEATVLGMGISGVSVSRLLKKLGFRVHVSDTSTSAELLERADALAKEGMSFSLSGHDIDRAIKSSLIVTSPGIPSEAPVLQAARDYGVPIASEIEIALRLMPAVRSIAITGTNGKSTVTALVASLLRALGYDAKEAGNFGIPLSSFAIQDTRPEWVVLELSSFQLHDTPSIQPDVGVLTNLSPDHMDRYPSLNAYYSDKSRLFLNDDIISKWVIPSDIELVFDVLQNSRGVVSRFSVEQMNSDSYYDREGDTIVVNGINLMPRSEIGLLGDHNIANVIAATSAVIMADESHHSDKSLERIRSALTNFRAISHRLEPVPSSDKRQWINDSKSTNVASSKVALEAMTSPTLLLLGGKHKGEPYTDLVPEILKCAKVVICYGEAAEIAYTDISQGISLVRDVGDSGHSPLLVKMPNSSFSDVLNKAYSLSSSGDVILLSPACSSYDQFRNYMERGDAFRQFALNAK